MIRSTGPLLAALLLLTAACSDPAAPTDGPALAKKSLRGGAGGGTCTLEMARQDETCGRYLAGLLGGGLATGQRCLAGSLIGCGGGLVGIGIGGGNYRDQADPWWQPWWEDGNYYDQPVGGGGHGWVPLGGP